MLIKHGHKPVNLNNNHEEGVKSAATAIWRNFKNIFTLQVSQLQGPGVVHAALITLDGT